MMHDLRKELHLTNKTIEELKQSVVSSKKTLDAARATQEAAADLIKQRATKTRKALEGDA